MPKRRIRSLAICVFSHAGSILASQGYDPVKDEFFFRPLGGQIEFGEYAAEALRRELLEELQAEVSEVRYLATLENIFVFDGKPGHEIVMVFDGKLADESLYSQPVIERIDTHSGEKIKAYWKHISEFGPGKPPLYPTGLLELLLKNEPPA